jgi:hypothetical protein
MHPQRQGSTVARLYHSGSTPRAGDFDIEFILKSIVYCDYLVDQLANMGRGLLENLSLDPANPLNYACITQIHPFFTSLGLPEVIYIEHDSED